MFDRAFFGRRFAPRRPTGHQDRMVAELEALHSPLRSLLEAAQQAAPPVTSRTQDMAPDPDMAPDMARHDMAPRDDSLAQSMRSLLEAAQQVARPRHLPNTARDDMVRAVALVAHDRMTRPLLTFPPPALRHAFRGRTGAGDRDQGRRDQVDPSPRLILSGLPPGAPQKPRGAGLLARRRAALNSFSPGRLHRR
jgi:hypothetical protein